MSWIVDATGWIKQAFPPIYDGKYPSQLRPEGISAVSMDLNLSTAGRLGFFIDYSERETVGDHTFYVARTHGTQGTVGCTWTAYDSADGTELATGVLYWRDQSADIKEFTVNVPSKPAGDHRIYVLLSAPEGGAVLHHGEHTVAYGIIDDGTIATSNAIFIDADAVTDGDGSQGSPYNNWYSARDAVTASTRVMHIKGKMTPDGTDVTGGSDTLAFMFTQNMAGRSSETERLVIRNWPGFIGGIDGGGQNHMTGFFIDGRQVTSNLNYITLYGLEATNLDNTELNDFSHPCFFLRIKGESPVTVEHITAENIKIDGVASGADAAVAAFFSENCDNFRMWRCDIKNTVNFYADKNLLAFESYRTGNVSIQRCNFYESAGGVYEKEAKLDVTEVGYCLRFNVFNNCGARLSTQGGRQASDHHIIQNNIFTSLNDAYSESPVRFDLNATVSVSEKQLISNNVFYNYVNPSTAAALTISTEGWEGVIIYNNIFYECNNAIRVSEGAAPSEFIDYNHYQNDILSEQPEIRYLSGTYVPVSTFNTDTGFESNASSGTPVFVDAANGDFTLQTESVPTTSGVDGTPQGVHFASFIEIGAQL